MAVSVFDSTQNLTRHDDYTEFLIAVDREQLVLLNQLKRVYPGMKTAKAWERTNELRGKQVKSYSAVAEGTDKTGSFSMQPHTLVRSVMELGYSDGYSITREAVDLNGGHIDKDELKVLIEDDGANFARSIEHILGSRQECVAKTASNTVTKTRGLMCWLQPGAHTVHDVAAGYRPAAELTIAAGGTLTEEALKAHLLAVRQSAAHALTLTGFVGIGLKIAVADFLNRVPTTANITQTLTRTVDYRNTEIFQSVDFLKYDSANIKLIALDGIDCDATTLEPTATSGMSGAFIELKNFQVEFGRPITHEDLSPKLDLGSGKKGWHHAMFRLNSTGLTGSFRVTQAAAAE